MKRTILATTFLLAASGVLIYLQPKKNKLVNVVEVPKEPTITQVTTAPTATPTIDMQKLYGPCAKVNVLMYHHIQSAEQAKKKNQGGLSVDPAWFQKQMEYIKTKGYTVITMKQLINFFDSGINLPSKPVMITLDDGYEDNFTEAWPILKSYGYVATIFTPTGLVNNPDYFSWSQMGEMKNNVYFANHTWSHHSSSGSKEVLEKELDIADRQLAEHGFNGDKVFAYPYGKSSDNDKAALKKYGYKLAFTTTHGNWQCKGKRYDLPRIRVGNAPLGSYGL